MLSRLASSAGLLAGRLASQLASGSAAGAAQALQQAAAASGLAVQHWGATYAQQRAGFATNSHDIFNVHKDSPENNIDIPFEFTPANMKRVR